MYTLRQLDKTVHNQDVRIINLLMGDVYWCLMS